MDRNVIPESEKEKYIAVLTEELPMLRVKVGVSQDELAGLIGVSRQTYGVIERRERSMSWNTYLALIFIFASSPATSDLIRRSDAFPHRFIEALTGEQPIADRVISELSDEYGDVIKNLDEQAIHSIRTMIMIEYARCTNQSGDAVVKSFDGKDFLRGSANADVSKAIRNIRGRKNGK